MYVAANGLLSLAASDLMNYSDCSYLTWLERERAFGRLPEGIAASAKGDDASLIADKGDQHEREFLADLRAEVEAAGERMVAVPGHGSEVRRAEREQLTIDAMRAGAKYVVQAAMSANGWGGVADLLERVDGRPSALGDFSYEVVDIKLARSVKPAHVLQLCTYSRLLAGLQGNVEPRHAYIVLGTRERIPFVLADYMSWFLALRRDFLEALDTLEPVGGDASLPRTPYPEPVSRCATCDWAVHCGSRRTADDHLSLVANIRRDQRGKLAAEGIDTVARLAVAADEERPARLARDTFERLREQAALQVEARDAAAANPDEPTVPPVRLVAASGIGRGFAQLPPAHPDDIHFDLEGDPYIIGGGTGVGKGGLEYLWGAVTVDAVTPGAWRDLLEPEPPATDPAAADQPYRTYLTGAPGTAPCLPADAARTPRFHAWWAHDPESERAAFEGFVDWAYARWIASDRQLHVYHYADYEITAIKRMMGRYASREREVDELLRGGAFVDLLRVVRQSIRAGVPSYSIKKVEALYRPPRQGDVTTAGSSIVDYEAWLTSKEEGRRDDGLLRGVAHYNRDDCVSTYQLQQWLLEQKARDDAPKWEVAPVGTELELAARAEKAAGLAARTAETDAFKARLLDGVPERIEERDVEQQARYLLAHAVDFHRRDAKPDWWAFFERQNMGIEELTNDTECIAQITRDTTRGPELVKQSHLWHYRYAPQESKLSGGRTAIDARDASRVGTLEYVDPETHTLGIKRSKKEPAPEPFALMPGGPIDTSDLEACVRTVATAWADRGDGSAHPLAAALLRRDLPVSSALVPGAVLVPDDAEDVARVSAIAAGLRDSYLFVQGPPGAGKTYTGSHVIADLLAAGRTVGVTGPSHKAIHNLLAEVEDVVAERGQRFAGRYKCSGESSEFASEHGFTTSVGKAGDIRDELRAGSVDLVAGTAFFFAKFDGEQVDCLVVDEAGQVSIANVVAMSLAARSMVLLGDPQQLPQVAKGTHPPGLERSILEHLLGEHRTVPGERGVLLPVTRRMAPELTDFISRSFYDSRLHAHACTDGNRVLLPGSPLDGAGVRRVDVPHEGNSTVAPEEVDRIAELVAELTRGEVEVQGEAARPVLHEDIIVVAPYNVQVNELRSRLPDGVQVGTVDKFQGQQAAIVIFSVTSSDREAVPRGLDFLLSPNRMNVAMSRARALAILVASPALGRSRAGSLDEMRLLSLLESAR